jgi:hypothetical protein
LIPIGRKSESINPGYVWAPYIPMYGKPIIIQGKNSERKIKIEKLLIKF